MGCNFTRDSGKLQCCRIRESINQTEGGHPCSRSPSHYCPLFCSCHCIHPSETPRGQHTTGCKPDLQIPQLQLQLAQSTGSGLNMCNGAQQHGAAILAAEQCGQQPASSHQHSTSCQQPQDLPYFELPSLTRNRLMISSSSVPSCSAETHHRQLSLCSFSCFSAAPNSPSRVKPTYSLGYLQRALFPRLPKGNPTAHKESDTRFSLEPSPGHHKSIHVPVACPAFPTITHRMEQANIKSGHNEM